MKNKKLEGRAYAAIGHASRRLDNLERAQTCHEKELELALKAQDKKAEARACSSLGNVYRCNGDVDAALKLHKQHLALSEGTRVYGVMAVKWGSGNYGNEVGEGHGRVTQSISQ